MSIRMLLALATAALLLLASWSHLFADERADSATKIELKALRGAVLTLAGEIRTLREENHQLRVDFQRHSHPVKIWNGRREKVSEWSGGTYFIGLPKVGKGGTDDHARKAGGTWGTP